MDSSRAANLDPRRNIVCCPSMDPRAPARIINDHLAPHLLLQFSNCMKAIVPRPHGYPSNLHLRSPSPFISLGVDQFYLLAIHTGDNVVATCYLNLCVEHWNLMQMLCNFGRISQSVTQLLIKEYTRTTRKEKEVLWARHVRATNGSWFRRAQHGKSLGDARRVTTATCKR